MKPFAQRKDRSLIDVSQLTHVSRIEGSGEDGQKSGYLIHARSESDRQDKTEQIRASLKMQMR